MEWFRGDSGGRVAGALTSALGEIDDDSADGGRGIVDLDLERGVAVVRIGRRGDQAV
jgi:hypothetical protein